MDDFMIWAIPLTFFLCLAAVQALRRHWQNALCAALAAGLFLAIMACAGQAHTSAILRAKLHHQEGKITELERQLGKETESSNQSIDGTR